MKKTILLTGATGFLGSYMLKRLLDENFEVIILKRSFSNTSRIEKLLDKVKSYDADKIKFKRIFEENNVDYILHCATNYGRKNNDPLEIVEANLILPLKLLHEGLKNDLKVFINTDTVIDKRINNYSLSKKQFLDWLKVYSSRVKCINVSLEHFYGFNDDDSKFVTHIIRAVLNNVPEIDLTSGEQKRDFIYIDDAVEGFMKIIQNLDKNKNEFEHYEIGSGNNISIKETVTMIKKIAANTVTKLNFGKIPYRENEIMNSCVDISKLLSLGWKPKVALGDGLKMTIEAEKGLMK